MVVNVQILLATSNDHKLHEVRNILEPMGIQVEGLGSLDKTHDEPIEDAKTFEGNARLKAVGYALATGIRCMADDSGLSVDALDGKPGVLSARFAGIGETRDERDQENNALLLQQMQNIPVQERTAKFMCALCVADPDGTIVAESTGVFEGIIGFVQRGDNGFGYDPLFFVPSANKTSAEMSSKEKNQQSHRGDAVRKIRPKLLQ
jgi:XTP/dITP diphosphohydrolase